MNGECAVFSCFWFGESRSPHHLCPVHRVDEGGDALRVGLALENACFKHVLNHFYHKNVFNDIGKLKPLYFDNTTFYSNDREFLIRLCLYNKKNYFLLE